MSRQAWTIDTAMVLIRIIAAELKPRYFVGITGSVLMNGCSAGDLDLIVYPASSAEQDQGFVREVLSKSGLVQRYSVEEVHAAWRRRGSLDTKHVEVWEYNGRKVDFFFLL